MWSGESDHKLLVFHLSAILSKHLCYAPFQNTPTVTQCSWNKEYYPKSLSSSYRPGLSVALSVPVAGPLHMLFLVTKNAFLSPLCLLKSYLPLIYLLNCGFLRRASHTSAQANLLTVIPETIIYKSFISRFIVVISHVFVRLAHYWCLYAWLQNLHYDSP